MWYKLYITLVNLCDMGKSSISSQGNCGFETISHSLTSVIYTKIFQIKVGSHAEIVKESTSLDEYLLGDLHQIISN